MTDEPRIVPGGQFLLDGDDEIVALWGVGQEVLWAEGEGLMIAGGVGTSLGASRPEPGGE